MATLPEAVGYAKNEIELKTDTVQLEPYTVEQKLETLQSNLTGEQQTGKL